MKQDSDRRPAQGKYESWPENQTGPHMNRDQRTTPIVRPITLVLIKFVRRNQVVNTLRRASVCIILTLLITAGLYASLCAFCAAEEQQGAPKASAGGASPAATGTEPASTVTSEKFYRLPLSGMADEGRFYLYVNETLEMTGTFEWKEDGSYESRLVRAVAGRSAKLNFSISVDSGGFWTKMHLESPRGATEIVRKGNFAFVEGKKQRLVFELTPRTVIFGNFDPALMALAVRVYDQKKGGKQSLSVFMIPGAVVDGSIEREESLERVVAGKKVKLTRYTYGLPSQNISFFVDEQGKVVCGSIPDQRATYVREGYDELLKPVAGGSAISQPEQEVIVERDVQVPMRDGINLATDVYRPKADAKFPVVLVRTPYDKKMNETQANFFASRGYVYAVQNCRGRFASGGEWEPFVNEAKDGYDAVEWAGTQDWSTGKVGMIGGSYLGWVQWWAASDRPPHLVTIIPSVSPPDPYFDMPYENGVFSLSGAVSWVNVLESRTSPDVSSSGMSEVMDAKQALLLGHLPVVELDQQVFGGVNPYWRKWIAHPDNDSYWEPANFLEHLEGLDIPVFHQSGWFDRDGIGTELNYLKMLSYGHQYQKLVIGPWGRTDTATRSMGGRDFGEGAIIDLRQGYVRWLDHWLKGTDNGIDKEPMVSVFVMGSNKWLTGDTYPLPETQMTKYYLTSGGHANTSNGDGRLTLEAPGAKVAPDRYAWDPGDPTPSPYYYFRQEDLVEKEKTSGSAYSVDEEKRQQTEYYGKVDGERRDILVYETPPLQDSLTVAGPVSAVLFASSSAKDTDWFMRLSEVDAEGHVFFLTEGKIRARYRDSFSKPELLKPGKVYEYHLNLWQTGITVPPGSKLRVEVASGSFPAFSRNLNTGKHNETETKYVVAKQKIYHDARYPSHVLLPVIPSVR